MISLFCFTLFCLSPNQYVNYYWSFQGEYHGCEYINVAELPPFENELFARLT